MDSQKYADVAGKFNMTGFPTLRFFKNGIVSDYTGKSNNDIHKNFASK